MAQKQFKAESKRLLDLMINSIYTHKEIFLRELISNASDATDKLYYNAMKEGKTGITRDALPIELTLDKANRRFIIEDHGCGMTAEELESNLGTIARSGSLAFKAENEKQDDIDIIGQFGVGFYSAFMVADKVTVISKAYGADQAWQWESSGADGYEMNPAEKDTVGTDIILHIDDDTKEFLEKNRIQELLTKYCRFLPVPIAFGKKTIWKDGKETDTDEDNIINDTNPLWTRKPSELKDEDYLKFYHDLYPMADDPLFWIHLNVDYPFNLTGVLYFPKIKNNLELQRNKIQLYCNQVFVTDSVENIVPDFLTLLHGVIDSPDIPLNVSRSYLQSDSNVKKISTYITKKVADRLQSIFKENRKEFEEKWDDLKLFINYGLLTEADFYDRAKSFALLKDVDGKYFTYDEYNTLIKDNQTDKNGNIVYLYANDKEAEYTYIEAAKAKGYSVLLMEGQLDTPVINMLEQKFEKSRFSRVDSDAIDRLIQKEDAPANNEADKEDCDNVAEMFNSQLPKLDHTIFRVETRSQGAEAAPVTIIQSEYMRRMKEMSRLQAGMSFYSEMPDEYTLILNSDHRLVREILDEGKKATADSLAPISSELKGLKARHAALKQQQEKKKADEITDDDRNALKECDENIKKQKDEYNKILGDYAAGNKVLHQLIDLALLQNGMLRGEALSRFVSRSVELIK